MFIVLQKLISNRINQGMLKTLEYFFHVGTVFSTKIRRKNLNHFKLRILKFSTREYNIVVDVTKNLNA